MQIGDNSLQGFIAIDIVYTACYIGKKVNSSQETKYQQHPVIEQQQFQGSLVFRIFRIIQASYLSTVFEVCRNILRTPCTVEMRITSFRMPVRNFENPLLSFLVSVRLAKSNNFDECLLTCLQFSSINIVNLLYENATTRDQLSSSY